MRKHPRQCNDLSKTADVSDLLLSITHTPTNQFMQSADYSLGSSIPGDSVFFTILTIAAMAIQPTPTTAFIKLSLTASIPIHLSFMVCMAAPRFTVLAPESHPASYGSQRSA